jgi:hypothetical protein
MATIVLPALALVLSAGVFAPGVVSTSADEGPFAFAPDGRTIYFTRFAAGMAKPGFFVSHLENGRWSQPKPAAFPDGASPAPFSISPDGERLYFTHVQESNQRQRLWVADRAGEGFKNARPLGDVFEKWDGDQTSPSVASDGTLYFTSNRRPGAGDWDIYRSVRKNGQYGEPELLGGGRYRRISTLHPEAGVAVAPDGSFLVFSSAGAPNGLGGYDLYLVELPGDERTGAWASNLGPLVNTPADEANPHLSADGKRLYFCRSGDIIEVDLDKVRRPPAESTMWKRRADMPGSREWPQLATIGGRIYVYGGLEPGNPRRWAHRVDVYDPASSSWSILPSPPADWKQGTLATLDDRLFLFRRGGPGVAEYRPESKQWEVKPASGTFAIGEAWPFQTRTVVVGRKAYTMFTEYGVAGSSFTYFVEYDFDTGAWTPRQSMAFPTPQLVAFDGRVYAFGEHTSVYDPATGQWTEAARVDMPRLESAVAVYGDEIWLIGGHGVRAADTDGDITPTVVRFNPRRNEWHAGPALPVQRAAAAAITVNGRLFLMGGVKPGTVFSSDLSVFEYVPGK